MINEDFNHILNDGNTVGNICFAYLDNKKTNYNLVQQVEAINDTISTLDKEILGMKSKTVQLKSQNRSVDIQQVTEKRNQRKLLESIQKQQFHYKDKSRLLKREVDA